MALVPGHAVLFSMTTTQSCFHQRSRTINLADSHVYSGLLADSDLALTIDDVVTPRRYQDGFESNDDEVDTTLIIRSVTSPTSDSC